MKDKCDKFTEDWTDKISSTMTSGAKVIGVDWSEEYLWKLEKFKVTSEDYTPETSQEYFERLYLGNWAKPTNSMFNDCVGVTRTPEPETTVTIEDLQKMQEELQQYRDHNSKVKEDLDYIKFLYCHPFSQHFVGKEYAQQIINLIDSVGSIDKATGTSLDYLATINGVVTTKEDREELRKKYKEGL